MRKMSQRRKGSMPGTKSENKANVFSESESQAEPHLSLHVTSGNQLIGQRPPECSQKRGSVNLKSRPLSTERQNWPYAMVIPTGSSEDDLLERNILPKVSAYPERTNTKEYLSTQIPPAPPPTAKEMPLLKVILKGKPALKLSGSSLHPVEKANKMSGFMTEELNLPTAPPVTRTGTEISEVFTSAVPVPATLPLKPALLPCVGNVRSLSLNEKKKKMTKYKVTLKKSKDNLESSIPDTKTETTKMESESQEIVSERMQEKRMQSLEMEEAQHAVRILVQEAKVLSEEEIRPSSVKINTKKKGSPTESLEEMQTGSAPRSVDEIIDSLWQQVQSETISDSDRRIQEIMNRVMSRGMVQKNEELHEKSGEKELSDASDISSQKQEMAEETEEEKTEGRKETFVVQEQNVEPEKVAAVETEGTNSEDDDVCITAEDGPWDIGLSEKDENSISKLRAILDLPLNVSREDILSLKGQQIKRFSQISLSALSKSQKSNKTEMSFLSSWMDEDIITGGGKLNDQATTSDQKFKHHHFCMVNSDFEIQPPFTHAGLDYHTPNKLIKDFPIQECRKSIQNEKKCLKEIKDADESNDEATEDFSDVLDEWVKQAEEKFTDVELKVKGNTVPTVLTNNMHFWTLSPPKLHIIPGLVTQLICPKYHGSFQSTKYVSFDFKKSLQTRTAAQILADDSIEKTDKEIEQLLKIRLLQQKCKSITKLTHLDERTTADSPDSEESSSPELIEKPSTEFSKSNSPEDISGRKLYVSKSLPTLIEVEKPNILPSAENKEVENKFLALPSDFESLHTEMQRHTQLICKMEQRKKENLLVESSSSKDMFADDVYSILATVQLEGSKKLKKGACQIKEVSKQQGSSKSSKIKQNQSQPGAMIQKNKSRKASKIHKQKHLRSASIFSAAQKSGTGPSIFYYVVSKGFGGKTAAEKLSALPKACRDLIAEWKSGKVLTKKPEEDLLDKNEISDQSDQVSDILPYSESRIDICSDDLEDPELNKKIWFEIDSLTKKLMYSPNNWLFITCRRGILYRKVGEINRSFEDLEKVIKAERGYLDAYWHRHFLYVLRGDYSSALDDLRFVLKYKPSYKVYMALGLLYEKLNDVNSALTNYTLAIHFNSSNYLAYYYRAKLYESSRNTHHAIGDYIHTSERNPRHAEALRKQAEYFLSVKNYNVAISKFGRLLQLEVDPEAYLYRAEAYISQKMWIPALGDLSAAIRLCPSSWKAYYLRGCLLKNDVKEMDRVIMDFSISLLLNDTIENKGSYMQRGIMYINKKCPKQAAADFSNILEFEPNDIDSLINLGLINLKNFHNFTVAVVCFSKVIALDALQIKAYQFRGEAYTKLYKYQLALRDYTHIIHMEPNNYMYYFYLGDIFIKMKKKKIASFFLELLSIVDSSVSLPMSCELAAVHSYLTHYDKALSILQKALGKNSEDPQLMMSLGTTQLEARHYRDALVTFNELRVIVSCPEKGKKYTKLADDVFYYLGMAYMALKQEKKALVAFNRAIEINPRHAPCLYNRGLAKIHLNLPHGILDFNKALAINSEYYEVYMSRAAYFAMKKNYTKAILNCNEALKIHSDSVRAFLYRGSIKYFIGVYKLAVADLTKAIELRGNFALAFFNRAVCYEALENYEKALCDYSVVLLVSDELNFNVFINRGRLYYQLEDFENAKEDFREASKLKPKNHKIIHAWGLCLHKLGKLDAAKEMFTRCIKTARQFLDAYISRGNVYMDYTQEKEIRLASYDYKRAVKLHPDNVLARICLGYSLQVLGMYQKAWQQFSEAFIIDPNNDAALEGRAAVCLQMGNVYAAFQDLNAAIRICPTAEFYNNRGVVNQHMNCVRDAMTDYKHAIELDPGYALAYYNAANIYLHGRFFKQALKYFNEAINLDPTDECAFINRAVTKVMLKDIGGASSDFDQAHKMCPYYAHIYFNRGNLYASLQKYKLAEKDFTLALEIFPDDPLTLVQRANVRGKIGEKDLAIQDYKRAMKLKEML